MYSPAWIIQQKSINSHYNEHSSFICCNEKGIYVVYKTDIDNSTIATIIKLNKNGQLISKLELSHNNSIPAICCNKNYIFISLQYESNIILYKIDCDSFEYVIKKYDIYTYGIIYITICCDELYIYIAYIENNIILIRKISTDDLNESWIVPFHLNITNNEYDRVSICKNSHGIYIAYFENKSDKTYLNIVKIYKYSIEYYNTILVFDNINKLSVPTICCDILNIYITYTDLQHNLYILKFKLDCNLEWNIKRENNNENIYNIDPFIYCMNYHIFITYCTNGLANDSDIAVLKVNIDGNDVVACQFIEFNTIENDIEPSLCAETNAVYVSYTTYGKTDSNIVIFKLDMKCFQKNNINNKLNVLYYCKYISHKHPINYKIINIK